MIDDVNYGLLRRLERPKGKVDVVIDTDTYNEIDDQYALAYLIKSSEKLNLKAIYAAPFSNRKARTPKEGMEKSYDEINRILKFMGRNDLREITFRGSEAYLSDELTPENSPAVEDLIKRAGQYSAKKPLYIVAIGAITNIASAILADPEIVTKIVVVWLGGNALNCPCNKEFNLYQDIAAARVVFDSGAAVVQLPCEGVVSELRTSGPELEHHLRGKNELCDYLIDVTRKEAEETDAMPTWTRVIWDVAAVAWLLDGDFMEDYLIHSPVFGYDHKYSFDFRRHFIRYVYKIQRDSLFRDLFTKLGK